MTEHRRRVPWGALGTGAVVGATVAVAVVLAVVGVPGKAPATRPPAAASSSSALSDRPSVVFLGDSWTEGIGATGLRGTPTWARHAARPMQAGRFFPW